MISESDGNMRGYQTTNLLRYSFQLGEEHLMNHASLTLVGKTAI